MAFTDDRILRRRLGVHALFERLGGFDELGAILGGHAVPRGVRDHDSAEERRQPHVEHVLRVLEDLQHRAPGRAASAWR